MHCALLHAQYEWYANGSAAKQFVRLALVRSSCCEPKSHVCVHAVVLTLVAHAVRNKLTLLTSAKRRTELATTANEVVRTFAEEVLAPAQICS